MSRRTETAYKAVIRASQHNMTKPTDSGEAVNAAAQVAKDHVLIRGGLSHWPDSFFSARYLVTAAVMRQESAEAIVGVDVAAAIRQLETSRGGTPEALPHRRAER